MKFCLAYLFMLMAGLGWSQNNFLPTHHFFKDQLFSNQLQAPYNGGGFFPVTEREYALIPAIIDSSSQYSPIKQTLFNKHLIELKGEDYFLTISPTFAFSMGQDVHDTSRQNLFQNTRGFIVEGDLLENISFSTSFYENQARFTNYESEYFSALGELYPTTDSSYQSQNAVIPGSGRTKPFKQNGFDYAYAIGNLVYTPFKQITISTGNNQHFIGDGHRSLLLSDNSYSAPYLRLNWKINSLFQFSYLRARHLNLIRRPATGSVESYYESKGYSVNYLTYAPTENLNISLFEGTVWNRGNAVTSLRVHPLFYNPIPFVSHLILKTQNELTSVFGINAGFQIAPKHRVYGQLALNGINIETLGFQLGYRGYNFFGLQDFMVQTEYNYVPNELYQSDNRRLNYTHYNMPLGHIRGDGFQELVVRSNYEIKRIYAAINLSYYMFKNHDQLDLLPVKLTSMKNTTQTYNYTVASLEMGYRMNRKLNFCIFGALTYRESTQENSRATAFLNLGMRTGLINTNKDF